jgi:hypothetical protein
VSESQIPAGEADQPLIRHIVLLGDSLLRARADIAQEPGKLEGTILPQTRNQWRLTLVTSADVEREGGAPMLPADASHIVIFVEGNDAIEKSGLLLTQPKSYREALQRLALAADEFERNVQQLIRVALASRLPTVVCTMLPPRYRDPGEQQAAYTALAVFNDRISRRAIEAQLSIIDLRLVCNEAEDYANPRMLSPAGMRKVANVVRYALFEISAGVRRSEVFF